MKLFAETNVKRTKDGYTVRVNDSEFHLSFDGEMRVGFEMRNGTYMPINLSVVGLESPRLFVAFVLTNGELRSLAESGRAIMYEGARTGLRVSIN